MLTAEDINLIRDLIEKTIKDIGIESTLNYTQKIIQPPSDLDSPVQKEIFRRKLVQEIIDLDESDIDEATKKKSCNRKEKTFLKYTK